MIYSHTTIYYEVVCDKCRYNLYIYDYNGKKIIPKFKSIEIALNSLKECNWKIENNIIICSNCFNKKLKDRYK